MPKTYFNIRDSMTPTFPYMVVRARPLAAALIFIYDLKDTPSDLIVSICCILLKAVWFTVSFKEYFRWFPVHDVNVDEIMGLLPSMHFNNSRLSLFLGASLQALYPTSCALSGRPQRRYTCIVRGRWTLQMFSLRMHGTLAVFFFFGNYTYFSRFQKNLIFLSITAKLALMIHNLWFIKSVTEFLGSKKKKNPPFVQLRMFLFCIFLFCRVWCVWADEWA